MSLMTDIDCFCGTTNTVAQTDRSGGINIFKDQVLNLLTKLDNCALFFLQPGSNMMYKSCAESCLMLWKASLRTQIRLEPSQTVAFQSFCQLQVFFFLNCE